MKTRYLVNFDTRELPGTETQLLVIGAGVAGLCAACTAAKLGVNVTLLAKGNLTSCNTYHAQGGIAAAVGDDDNFQLHYDDTILAGAGLCEGEAVKVLVSEGPARIQELINLGAGFDCQDGILVLGKEGCHSRSRILHARGDATGAELHKTLTRLTTDMPSINIRQDCFVVDLLVANGVCYGVLIINGTSGRLEVIRSRAVILATGGGGQLYRYTTNPVTATADGVALAYRAGARQMDMEFVQFHPTALVLPDAPRFLISEAVRGEGAILRNKQGERFMPNYHHMYELAPRDVVTRAILSEMSKTEADAVYLDITHLDANTVKQRFPTIHAECKEYGIDITTDLIPVAPAAHYMMGGIKTDLWGQTSIKRLFSCGEASCLGIHGSNRLASNSLLEGLVMGRRAALMAIKLANDEVDKPEFANEGLTSQSNVDIVGIKQQLQQIMEEKVGPLRDGRGLKEALTFFGAMEYLYNFEPRTCRQMELYNMLTVGELITRAALLRTESRGGHFRLDFPESSTEWCKHIIF